MRRTRKTKNREGGDFIASGTYGCVFSPPLQCKAGSENNQAATIGKVFESEKYANEEIVQNERIITLDPMHKFTLPYYGHCTTIIDQNTLDVKKCGLKTISTIQKGTTFNALQLLYAHGGFELAELYEKPERHIGFNFEELLINILPVLEGLQTIQNAGYIHADVKPQNILYNPLNHRIYLIDFGLMQKNTDLKSFNEMMRHEYQYYPMESLLINNYMNYRTKTLIQDALKRFSMYQSANNALYYLWKYGNAKAQMRELFALNLEELSKWPGFEKCFDTYGLAFSLLEIYTNTITKPTPLIEKFMGQLILPMLHFNPYKRMQVAEAISVTKKILNLKVEGGNRRRVIKIKKKSV